MNKSDCTVIIAVKDGTNFLAEAVASVRAQSSSVSRIIVIDDHSEDEVIPMCRELEVECITSNGYGQAAATNTGIKLVKTEYIAILDHDDWWDKDKTKLQSEYLDANPSAFGVYSQVFNVYSDNRPTVQFPATRSFGSSMLRRNIFEEVGLIDETYTSANVIVWWSEVAKRKIRVDSLDIPALNRRIHDDNFGIMQKDKAEENLMLILRAKVKLSRETK